MRKTPISLQDLRMRLEVKAKAERSHRFWGMYVHVCKASTLREAYRLAKRNDGSAGSDGMTFAQIEAEGLSKFIADISYELRNGTYQPLPVKEVRIPKPGKKVAFRTLKIPAIRDRVVQGALKLILEPIFEADFQNGSYGYRPNRSPHGALERVRKALAHRMRIVINIDLRSYFDTVRHHTLLGKIARRINDPQIMNLCKKILKSCGNRGVAQGSLIGPLMSNIYLNELDAMLEKARVTSMHGRYETINYVRFADDLLVFVSDHSREKQWVAKVEQRLRQEIGKLDLTVNEDKSPLVNLNEQGSCVDYLGFRFRMFPGPQESKKLVCIVSPQKEKRTSFLREIRQVLKKSLHIPVKDVIKTKLNAKIRGWVNYFAWGNSGDALGFVSHHIDKKVRRFASRQRHLHRKGHRSWTSWSKEEIYDGWGLFSDYRVSWSRASRI